jgi:hypothetical protein
MADLTPTEISARIRQVAKSQGIDPDTLVNIAKAESSLKMGADAKTSSAKGLFGVIDSTWRQYGGDPAKRSDVDENIRVGARVVADNQSRFKRTFNRDPAPAELYAMHVFGPNSAPSVLRADSNSLLEKVISPKAMKANPYWKNKTVGQVLSQFEEKVGKGASRLAGNVASGTQNMLMPAIRAARSKVPVIRGSAPAMQPLTRNSLEELGPSYQAAMAAMALAGTSDDDEDEAVTQKLADRAAEQEEAAAAAPVMNRNISNMDLSYASPFEEEAPVQLADGGDPRIEKSDARDMLDRLQMSVNAENMKDKYVNMDVGSGRVGYDFPTEGGSLTAGVSGQAVRGSFETPEGKKKFNDARLSGADIAYQEGKHRVALQMLRDMQGKGQLGGAQYGYNDGDSSFNIGMSKRPKDMEGGLEDYYSVNYNKRFADGGPVYRADGSSQFGEFAGFPVDEAPPSATPFADMTKGKSMSAADLSALGRIGKEAISNVESVGRGSVAAVPGFVGDIEAMFRANKKSKTFKTTEDILKDIPRYTAPTKEAKGFEEIGTFVDPFAMKKAVTAAPAAAKAAGKLVASSGPQIESALMKAAPAAQPMYAVKPKGGVFHPPESNSNIEKYLENIARALPANAPNIPGKDAKRVMDLIKDKGRKYLTTTFGTGSDPIREAISEGRLTLVGEDEEKLRKYMLAAARAGDPSAIQDVEKAYDRMTQLEGLGVIPKGQGWEEGNKIRAAAKALEKEKMLKEGVSEDALNTAIDMRDFNALSASYASDAEKALAELLGKKSFLGVAPPMTGAQKSVVFAANKGEPIYDLSSMRPGFDIFHEADVAKGIGTIPIDELERMTFPEMLIRGSQNTLLDRSADEVLAKVSEGKSIPMKFYSEGIKAVPNMENVGWVRIESPFAVKLEGASMGHSVGGYGKPGQYGLGGLKAFQSGIARIFSLRPEGKKPVTTVEVKATPDTGELDIRQIKGPYNSVPTAEEKQKVFELFDELKPKSVHNEDKYTHTRAGIKLDELEYFNWQKAYEEYLANKNK